METHYGFVHYVVLDRPYCSNAMFRALVLDNVSMTEAECRLAIDERLRTCQVETCPQCISPCNYPWAKAIADVFKCLRTQTHYGFVHYYMVSDAGQLALLDFCAGMHGVPSALRFQVCCRRVYPTTSLCHDQDRMFHSNIVLFGEKLSSHLYHIGHNNPQGLLQRDSSCRKEHRNSPMPHLTGGFDDNGNPISRSGFMVPCRRHSDCYSCGRHPLTGQFFQCQKRHKFYDTVRTSGGSVFEEKGITFLNISSASASAFDIDMEEAAITGMTGVCVDLDSSMNEGCGNEIAANIKDGLIGCFDGEFVAKFLCGLSLTVKHGDLSTVQTEGNLFWPRVLLNGSEDANGDGQGGMHLECTDPIDCLQKMSNVPCQRTFRGHGQWISAQPWGATDT